MSVFVLFVGISSSHFITADQEIYRLSLFCYKSAIDPQGDNS